MQKIGINSKSEKYLKKNAKANEDRGQEVKSKRMNAEEEGASEEYVFVKERPVSISLCTSAQRSNIAGLVSYLEGLKKKNPQLIKEVKFRQLPSIKDLDRYTFSKKDPVDVMILCHSFILNAFAITDVMNAMYDGYLPYCGRVIGKVKMGVIVHDFDDIKNTVLASQMRSFKYKQPKAFETTSLQILCGHMEKEEQVLNQMDKEDQKGLFKFLKNASRHPENMINRKDTETQSQNLKQGSSSNATPSSDNHGSWKKEVAQTPERDTEENSAEVVSEDQPDDQQGKKNTGEEPPGRQQPQNMQSSLDLDQQVLQQQPQPQDQHTNLSTTAAETATTTPTSIFLSTTAAETVTTTPTSIFLSTTAAETVTTTPASTFLSTTAAETATTTPASTFLSTTAAETATTTPASNFLLTTAAETVTTTPASTFLSTTAAERATTTPASIFLSTTAAETVTTTPASTFLSTTAAETVTTTPASTFLSTTTAETVTTTPGSTFLSTTAAETVTTTPGSTFLSTTAAETVTTTPGSTFLSTTAAETVTTTPASTFLSTTAAETVSTTPASTFLSTTAAETVTTTPGSTFLSTTAAETVTTTPASTFCCDDKLSGSENPPSESGHSTSEKKQEEMAEMLKIGMNSKPEKDLKNNAKANEDSDQEGKSKKRKTDEEGASEEFVFVKERPVSILLCTSTYSFNIAGLVSYLEGLKKDHPQLIREVKVHQLPYDLDSYRFPKEDPVDVMILCHSINNRGFAITDVMDALYDKYLPYCAKVIGKGKMGVIVHDFDDMREAVQSSRMSSFKHKQPKAFETTSLQITCGHVEKENQFLNQMAEKDRIRLFEFLKSASNLPENMNQGVFETIKQAVYSRWKGSYKDQGSRTLQTEADPSEYHALATGGTEPVKRPLSKPSKQPAQIREPRATSISVCACPPCENVLGLLSWLMDLKDKYPDKISHVCFRELPYSDMGSFRFPPEDPVDVMILCHSIENRGFSITNVTSPLYEEYLQYCHDVIGKKKLAVIVHDIPDLTPATVESRMKEFEKKQNMTFKLVDTVIICGRLKDSAKLDLREEDEVRLICFIEEARLVSRENIELTQSVFNSIRNFLNI